MGASAMGSPDDPVPYRSDHVDDRRGFQGHLFWTAAAAAPEQNEVSSKLGAVLACNAMITNFTTGGQLGDGMDSMGEGLFGLRGHTWAAWLTLRVLTGVICVRL